MAGYAKYDDSFDDGRKIVYGVLYDIGPALRIQDIEGLIKQCFQFRYFEVYEGLIDGEAFFAVDQDEFDHLEKSLVIYDGDIKIKRLHQKVQIYKIHLPDERKSAFLRRCATIAGIEAVDRDHLKCCEYQLKLIHRYLGTQGSKLADPTKILNPVEGEHDSDDDDDAPDSDNYDDLDFSEPEVAASRVTPKSFYAQMDEPEHRPSFSSNVHRSDHKRFEFRISYDHTFSHNGNLRSQNGLGINVKEADITEMNADCILNWFSATANIMDIVSNQIGEKAGLSYQIELTTQITTRNLTRKADESMVFHTSAGKMPNCRYIVQLGINPVDSENLAQKFKSLFDAYLQLFDYVESALSVRSLAIRMIGSDEDRDLSIISLIEALNQYYFHKTVCLKSNIKIRQHANLRDLYIVCLDPLPLMVLQEYLTNGFQADFLSQLFDETIDDDANKPSNSKSAKPPKESPRSELRNLPETESRTITETDYGGFDDDDDLETLQAKLQSLADLEERAKEPKSTDLAARASHDDSCVRCQRSGELAFVTWDKNTLYNHLIDFKGCAARQSKDDSVCEICSIFANLLRIDIKELLAGTGGFNSNTKACVCLRCYFELFIEKLKRSHCSSCLRDISSSTQHSSDSLNKHCHRHQICAKCSFLPKNMSYCYYCTVMKLYQTMFDHVSTSSHHDSIDCCFDYFDLSLASVDESVNESKKKMACGHLAFPESSAAEKTNKANICGFCMMTKLTNMILSKQQKALGYEVVDDLEIDEEQEDLEDDDFPEDNVSIESAGEPELDENNNPVPEAAIYTHIKYLAEPLPGFPNINTIELQFFIPNGVQKASDPQPGEKYIGTVKSVYLPGNRQGKELARMIGKIMDNDKLITIVKAADGKSWTARLNNRIELKTSKSGGVYNNGYPDEGYLDRLQKQLESL